MKFFILSFLLFCTQALASGPSTDAVDVDTMGLGVGMTEAMACTDARLKAIADAPKYYETSEWTYDFFCGSKDGGDEVEVVKSSCSCEQSKTDVGYDCLYEATVVCYETVWYD